MITVDINELNELKKGLTKYEKKCMSVIHTYGATTATNIKNDAKRRARWTNRTGQARQKIYGFYIKSNDYGIIRLQASAKNERGVYYSYHLEYSHGEKYKALRPARDKAVPRLTKTIGNRLSKVKIMG